MKLTKTTEDLLEYGSGSNFNQLYERYNQLNDSEHEVLVKDLIRISRSEILKDEYPRVPFCQLLICSAPVSAPIIDRLLTRFDNRIDYEVHFSLFSSIDKLQFLSDERSIASFILRIPYTIGRYLFQVPKSTAFAAWMAGDLLGDHWSIQPALPILLNMSISARYIAGREGGIHGLYQIYRRIRLEERALIDEALELIRKADRSGQVRNRAKWTIKRLRESAATTL